MSQLRALTPCVLAAWDKQQLQLLLKRLEANSSTLQSTLSSLQSLLQKSPSKAPAAKQAADAGFGTGGLWLPLLFAFILGCCFGAFWPRTRLTFRHA